VVLAGPFGFTKREFFEVEDDAQREPPRVSFRPDEGPAPVAAPPAEEAGGTPSPGTPSS
jgi:hypothetical protein